MESVPWRIFINGRYDHVVYAPDGHDAICQVNERLGYDAAATKLIKAYKANSASD